MQLLGDPGGLAAGVDGMDVEVVGPELVLVEVAAGDVPAGDENIVSDGDLGPLLPTPARQPPLAGGQIRAVGPGGRGFAQGPSEPSVTLARPCPRQPCPPQDSNLRHRL